jgi:hypothetical protein
MTSYKILLPGSYHELNTPARGYLEGVIVSFEDGREYELTFLDEYNRKHYGFYFEGQTVLIIEDVTAENIQQEVAILAAQDAFVSMPSGRRKTP